MNLGEVKMGEQANDPTYIGFSCIAEQYQRKVNIVIVFVLLLLLLLLLNSTRER